MNTVGNGVTPISRMGGKSKLARRLINWFPEFDIYCEPFLGAGNIFLRIPSNKLNDKKVILNDLDTDIYVIFDAIKKDSKEINQNIRREWLSREEFEKLKNKTDAISLIEKCKNSYYGKGISYSNIAKNFQNSKVDDKRDRSKEPSATKFFTDYEKIGNKLKNVTITNVSFEKLIKEYDSPVTFFYLDPPYENPKKNDYKDYVTPEEVYNALQEIKGKFMLSYNDSPNIRSIFSKYYITTVNTEYAEHKKKTEIVITNYILPFENKIRREK